MSFIVIEKGSVHSRFLGLSEKENCVFDIHIGKLSYPNLLILSIFSFATSVYFTSVAPYIFRHISSIFCFIDSFKLYANLKFDSFFDISITLFARSIAPSPPFPQHSTKLISILFSFKICFSNSISFLESLSNLLIATIAFKPNTFLILSICFNKFLEPFFRHSKFSFFISLISIPPWYFKAFIVATHTTASGFIFAILDFISINFSAPKSAPNPASVTT